ncbi:MAG: transposase, partial [Candidatus Methanodesulfokora sp.]
WFLFKGGSVLPQYEYYSKKIAKTQKVLARHGQRRSRLLTLLHEKRRRFLRHALNSMVRKIVSMLDEKGVSEVVVGYPKGIARRRGNKLTVNFWDYGFIVKRLKEVGEELGIKVVEVEEGYTSRTCSLCGEAHEGGRIFRGLFKCPRTGKAINADLNGAINILHIPESLGAGRRGQLPARDRGNGLKTQPVVYRWMNGAGWLKATSCEVMKMNVVNHKPVNRSKGTLSLQGGEEVSCSCRSSSQSPPLPSSGNLLLISPQDSPPLTTKLRGHAQVLPPLCEILLGLRLAHPEGLPSAVASSFNTDRFK